MKPFNSKTSMNSRTDGRTPQTPERVGIRWIDLFAVFISRWWVVLAAGALLTAASMMNSFALMRVNANMVAHREVLIATQNRLQAVESEMKSLKSKIPESSSNVASPKR